MIAELALIRLGEPEEIVMQFPAAAGRIALPGSEPEVVVCAPEGGWSGHGFRIAEVVSPVIPEGKQLSRQASLIDGVPTYGLEDVPIPDRVTSRQFFLQLNALDEATPGTYDAVMGWVTSQSRPVRDAFERSGTFVRDDAMLQQGFAALGFTPEQIDGFFTAAAGL